MKTKVTNVDIVNRSLDRTSLTLGVEFDYKDSFPRPYLGAEVTRTGEPQASSYFQTSLVEIKKSSQRLALFPIKFQPPDANAFATFSTDKIFIYLQDAVSVQRFNLFPMAMLVMWKAPGATAQAGSAVSAGTIELGDLKQSDLFSGYLTLKYTLTAPNGKIRVRIFDSRNERSASWFAIKDVDVKQGGGLQLVQIAVKKDADSPSDIIRADTMEVELVDSVGKVVANVKKENVMNWARPK